jgi:hypothetical protein
VPSLVPPLEATVAGLVGRVVLGQVAPQGASVPSTQRMPLNMSLGTR